MSEAQHLDLNWVREQFMSKPNPKLARWYLSNLLRYAGAGKIDAEQLRREIDVIKAWMKENNI